MKKELISIIVPVYNSEKYLERCLSSIIKQTYYNLEIIIIDDGSSDESLAIAKKHSHTDSRIRVISKDNEGVSKTRNRGLEESNGKYICFVDSDDYISPSHIDDLYTSVCNHNASVAVCKFANVFNKNGVETQEESSVAISDKINITRNDYYKYMSKDLYSVYGTKYIEKI